MRNVLFAGAAAALVFVLVNRAFVLMNEPNDLLVAAGLFLLLTVVGGLTEAAMLLWRRR
jgi:hypothetical protein